MLDENDMFESSLFGEAGEDMHDIYDAEFWVDRIVMFPRVRPLMLEKAVALCIYYLSKADFKGILLQKSRECPVLIYHLFNRGLLSWQYH